MTDYTELDTAICDDIARGNATGHVYAPILLKAAEAVLGRSQALHDNSHWRLIDRRLQALRKAGRINYDRKAGWSCA